MGGAQQAKVDQVPNFRRQRLQHVVVEGEQIQGGEGANRRRDHLNAVFVENKAKEMVGACRDRVWHRGQRVG